MSYNSEGIIVDNYIICKELELPFVPIANTVINDGIQSYDISKPEFYLSDWEKGKIDNLGKVKK